MFNYLSYRANNPYAKHEAGIFNNNKKINNNNHIQSFWQFSLSTILYLLGQWEV